MNKPIHQVQYTDTGMFAASKSTMTLINNGLLANSEIKSHNMKMQLIDDNGITYTINLLELAKKLNMRPETNAKPKKCYE